MGDGCFRKIPRIETITAPAETVTDGAEFSVYTSLGIIGFVINEGKIRRIFGLGTCTFKIVSDESRCCR